MVSPSSSQLATAFSGPPGFPPPIAASESRSIGMYAPYDETPTIEPSGWRGASVRLRPGDCKLDDARRRWPDKPRSPRACGDGNTGYTSGMKSAVSLPDDLFREIDACARAL